MKYWLVLLVVLAACGSGSASPYNSPADIAAKLQTKGGCLDFALKDPTASSSAVTIQAYEGLEAAAGKCTFNNEAVAITFFKDAGAKRNAIGLSSGFGCQFAKVFGMREFDFVEGGTWMVTPNTATTASVIREILGGSVGHIAC